jgi:hypothetical protein
VWLFTDIDFDIWGPHPDDDAKQQPRKVVSGAGASVGYAPASCRRRWPFPKGTLPTIVRKLLAARKAKRKEAEKEADPFRKALLDAEQLGLQTRRRTHLWSAGLWHLQDSAPGSGRALLRRYGRKQIMAAKEVIE